MKMLHWIEGDDNEIRLKNEDGSDSEFLSI